MKREGTTVWLRSRGSRVSVSVHVNDCKPAAERWAHLTWPDDVEPSDEREVAIAPQAEPESAAPVATPPGPEPTDEEATVEREAQVSSSDLADEDTNAWEEPRQSYNLRQQPCVSYRYY